MANDGELNRLKAAQDTAFQRKQDAYQAQESAWQHRKTAGDALNRAHENKQSAYEVQDSTWQEYQRIRSRNDPEIDRLKAVQETAFQNMKRAFENASAAHDRRDGAAARSYADEGHRFKVESQGYVNERRRLVDENKAARARHDAAKPAFQRTKDEFGSAKRVFQQAKTEHERKQSEFNRAKEEFNRADKAFQGRLDTLKSQSQQKKSDKRAIAEQAGVPYQYRDNVWISTDTDGNTNIYFGGSGQPNGPGHGHYVMDRNEKVTYKRDPFDPHGAQNFEGPGKDGHRGGFGKSQHGWIGDSTVTFALGWGTKQGETMLADGHLSDDQFRASPHHDHYGSGDGPHNNGTLRGKYTGPGG
jgi:hypothetical protein